MAAIRDSPSVNANNYVRTLALYAGTLTLYAGGYFTSISGQPRNHIASLHGGVGATLLWNPNANGNVYSLAVSGGTLYAGGIFNTIGGQVHPRIAAISSGQTVSVGGDPGIMEGALTVAPNPTGGAMQIKYAVARAGRVRLELLDVSGRVQATLSDRIQEPGRYVAAWDGAGRRERLSPGLYFLRLMAPDQVNVRKLAVVW